MRYLAAALLAVALLGGGSSSADAHGAAGFVAVGKSCTLCRCKSYVGQPKGQCRHSYCKHSEKVHVRGRRKP